MKSATHTPDISDKKVFDYMLEGCQIISRDYRYLYVNEAVARQGRSTKESLIGKRMTEMYPGIEKTAMFGRLQACIETGTVQNMENEFHFPDGGVGWFDLRIEPLPEGAIILSIDITEKKKAEERARELDALKTMFIKVVAHQLRTPLSIIRWNLERLLEISRGDLTASQTILLNTVYEANIETINRIADMLTAVDIEEGRVAAIKTPVAFETIWSLAKDELERACRRKNITPRYIVPRTPLPMVMCDRDKILAVILRLADNATTYTPHDGAITCTIEVKNHHLRFEITDTGIGIPEAQQQKVFTRFFRGTNATTVNPDASGVSLSIAKFYVDQHNGTIGFQSKQDAGSTFWFEIPLEQ